MGLKLAKEVSEHRKDSWDSVVSPQLTGWEEKESMLIGTSIDDLSRTTKSQVNDPRLSTIVLERAARVSAQNPTGKALAMSKDDRGKNILMNLIIDKWVLPNANSQFDFLIKSRLWDMYSMVYGTMFKLVDQISKDNYNGPDSWILPIRDCSPQPGKFSLADSDWFGVSTFVGIDWLKSRNKDTWKNIDEVILKMKEGKSAAKGENDDSRRTYIERLRQPSVSKDNVFKEIELYTEYRRGQWITIAPDFSDLPPLRDIGNTHKNDELPIVAKYCFPLLDSIFGLGEFERGKTLQFAMNSLWNMYLDGVRDSILPPIAVDPDGVVASSMVRDAAAIWLETKPNSIRPIQLNPQGIDTFQSTFNTLNASILNQAGTTDTTVSASNDPTQGKTPQALRMTASRENSRDNWDRFMMEKAQEEEMRKYVNLIVCRQDKPIMMRLFAKEIEEIAKIYPDVSEMLEMAKGDEQGTIKIKSEMYKGTKFDYQIVSGSAYKADKDKELENVQGLLDFTLKNYQPLQEAFAKRGEKIDLAELYQRSVINSGLQDSEKIIVQMTAEDQQAMMQAQMPQQPMNQPQMDPSMMQGAPQMPPQQMMPQQPQPQGNIQGNFADPEIQQLAQQMMRGI